MPMSDRFDECSMCGKTVSVRLDGLFRLHGDGAARTCPGSHQPSENITARDPASGDTEKLRMIRLARVMHANGEINSVRYMQEIDNQLDAP
jgi:hypothetical protein